MIILKDKPKKINKQTKLYLPDLYDILNRLEGIWEFQGFQFNKDGTIDILLH